MKKIFLLLALALAACEEVHLSNGEVPPEYQKYVQKYLGTYYGDFNGVPGQLHLALLNNKLILSVQNNQNNDLVGANCHSRIGNVTTVGLDEKNGQPILNYAYVEFDPQSCVGSIAGNEILVNVSETSTNIELNLKIVESRNWREECEINVGPNGEVIRNCHWVTDESYLYGHFSRD